MDKRLELTEKQKEIISRYNDILKEMKEAKIMGVFKYFDDVCLFNGEQVEDVFFEEDRIFTEDDIEITERVDTNGCFVVSAPFGLCVGHDEYFNVEFTESI